MHRTEFAARRRALGISQDELAKRLGVATTTVARWERGERPIQHPEMVRFSLQAIYVDLREEWEALPAEEKHKRNLAKMAEAQREGAERTAAMTPEQREAAERWFSPH
jgi:transcriptional regulator with XRE-family HTH domain